MLQLRITRVKIFLPTPVAKLIFRSFISLSSHSKVHRREPNFKAHRKFRFADDHFSTAAVFQTSSVGSSALVLSATSANSSRTKAKLVSSCTSCRINSQGSALVRRSYSTIEMSGMELKCVVSVLKKTASPSLAGSWDNVGLLLEPSPPHTVQKLLLTNDLTPSVMQEAVNKGVNMIVSYHPPIFAPLKRVTQSSWKERIVTQCLERRIALYSPHTSWDAVAQGVNDWLISAFDVEDVGPIEQTEQASSRNKKLTFWTTAESATKIACLPAVENNPNIHLCKEPVLSEGGEGEVVGAGMVKACVQCCASAVPTVLAALDQHCITVQNVECSDLAKLATVGHGMGRVGKLKAPVSVEEAVRAIKSHLNLQHVRLARAPEGGDIRSVAVCAGSGSSVLRCVRADLYLTGEMSHHEVLDAACKGTHVVLCDHSNTERGFLTVMQGRLSQQLAESKVDVLVSETDRDPLEIV